MMTTQIHGRPCEDRHDLCGHVRTRGPYVVVKVDDAQHPAFWIEVTIPTWRLLRVIARNLWPFGDHDSIEMKPRGPFRFQEAESECVRKASE